MACTTEMLWSCEHRRVSTKGTVGGAMVVRWVVNVTCTHTHTQSQHVKISFNVSAAAQHSTRACTRQETADTVHFTDNKARVVAQS
eukprot:m.123415 g.123415  ORF g.123415 m.123415 type:complete len:86 (-) comp16587_c0_seq3:3688-3945(-)